MSGIRDVNSGALPIRRDDCNRTLCETYLASLCDTAVDSVVVFTQTGHIRALSQRAKQTFGYRGARTQGMFVGDLLPMFRESPQVLRNLANGAVRLSPMSQRTTAQRANNETFPVEVFITSFYDDNELLLAAFVRSVLHHDGSGQNNHTPPTPLDRLSPRQRQILALVVEGYTSREIADFLTISIKTVETHRTNIMAKLEVENVIELVRVALKFGMFAIDG